jgi:hypothetical protein
MRGKKLAILIGVIIYVVVVIWGVGEGYRLDVALCWPLGLLILAAYGWAKLGRR